MTNIKGGSVAYAAAMTMTVVLGLTVAIILWCAMIVHNNPSDLHLWENHSTANLILKFCGYFTLTVELICGYFILKYE